MPGYAGNGVAKLMYENEQKHLFYEEAVAVGTMSVAYQLRRERGAFYPNGFSVEIAFSGDPGAFEIDVLGADQDIAPNYCPIAFLNSVNSVNASFVGRIECPTNWVKYVCLYVRSLANAGTVTVTAIITR